MNSAANDFSADARKNDLFDLAAIGDALDRQKSSATESEKYIVFSLGEDFYAVASARVAEIIRPLAAAPLPNAPQWISGIANLRGEIVPVVDLQNLLSGEDSRSRAPKSKFLILRPASLLPRAGAVAFAVDKLSEIVSLSTEQIEPHKNLSSAPCVFGTAAYKSTVVRLIDAKNLFSLMSI